MGVDILSPMEMKAVLYDTIAFEKVNKEIIPKKDPYTLVAANFYGQDVYLPASIAAAASTKSPIITEISYSSMKSYANSGHMEDGAALIKAYYETMQDRVHPIIIGEKEYSLDDAVIGVMVDHHKFADYLKKAKGPTNNEKYENAKQQFLSDIKATFELGGDIFSLHMVDAAEGTTYEQNVNVSREVLKLAKEYGKVVELEYTATGGFGEEGTGKHAADMSADEYPVYIQSIYKFIDHVTEGIGSNNLASIAFDFGTEHVARAGELLIPKYELLEQYLKYGLENNIATYPVVGHGGTSLSTEEVMRAVRGLLGKLNKATEPKRAVLDYLNNYINSNEILVEGNLKGLPLEDITSKLGREVTKKELDDTHHPNKVTFGAQVPLMELLQKYILCLSGENRTIDLYNRGVISKR